jgi:putative hydrolase of the HAD superfamily
MIKAVFFDLYHTLIHYHPPREEVLALNLSRRGIAAEVEWLRHAIVAGDEYYYQENAKKNLTRRTEEETRELWQKYQAVVLREAGIEPYPELVSGLLNDMQRATYERVLFSDVLPTLAGLSGRGLRLGLVSNVDQDITPLLDKLGLRPYLGVVLTSRDVGATKPEPRIFHEAVGRAGVEAASTLYIGDQYQIDVLGARGAGLKALLLDRENNCPEIPAADKIKSLHELDKRIP